MVIDDEITEFQSFTDRTLKYGRNLMAAAVPIIVFSFVPLVNLAKSRPFNFKIEAGGEIWLWWILLALLVYYGIRFFGLAIPDFLQWKIAHGEKRAALKNNLNARIKANQTQIVALDRASQVGDEEAVVAHKMNIEGTQNKFRSARSLLNAYNWRRTYFWITDLGLPTVLFGLALWASIDKILMLNCVEIPPSCAGGKTP